jgi:hypothetical protein
MGPREYKGPMHVLLKHIPLHEQMPMRDAIVLMDVGVGSGVIFEDL